MRSVISLHQTTRGLVSNQCPFLHSLPGPLTRLMILMMQIWLTFKSAHSFPYFFTRNCYSIFIPLQWPSSKELNNCPRESSPLASRQRELDKHMTEHSMIWLVTSEFIFGYMPDTRVWQIRRIASVVSTTLSPLCSYGPEFQKKEARG